MPAIKYPPLMFKSGIRNSTNLSLLQYFIRLLRGKSKLKFRQSLAWPDWTWVVRLSLYFYNILDILFLYYIYYFYTIYTYFYTIYTIYYFYTSQHLVNTCPARRLLGPVSVIGNNLEVEIESWRSPSWETGWRSYKVGHDNS